MRSHSPGANATLPDRLRPGIVILFVGINPGLTSAAVGHHFAGPSNRFWKLLRDSGLVSAPLTHQDDARLPDWGLGLTNIIHRPTRGIDRLAAREYAQGKRRLLATIRRIRPSLVALLGVTIYRTLFPASSKRPLALGLQPDRLAEIPLYLLPNPSGRNAHYSYREMLQAFRRLHRLARTRGNAKLQKPLGND